MNFCLKQIKQAVTTWSKQASKLQSMPKLFFTILYKEILAYVAQLLNSFSSIRVRLALWTSQAQIQLNLRRSRTYLKHFISLWSKLPHSRGPLIKSSQLVKSMKMPIGKRRASYYSNNIKVSILCNWIISSPKYSKKMF